MGIPGEERQKGTKEKFEIIMIKNFPQLMSDTKAQIQEAQKKNKQDKYQTITTQQN